MCGLTGILSVAPPANDVRGTIARMTAALHHRGPDAEGHWAEDRIALGHRRLSILDLSEAGAQPMQSACGRFVIAFNGEIYNHLDLRRDLEAAGVGADWRGHSDTETLLAGIAHWGLDEMLQRAAGMFAIALWDRKERRLSLARDRIGEKPLYWGWAGEALVFGSELKALRQHPGFPRDVCRQALALYLRFAYVPAPRSIHPGVYKLEPGCILTVDETPPAAPPQDPLRPGDRHGSLSIRRYWSLNEAIEAGGRNRFTDEGAALGALDTALRTAVGRQMLTDVPLGALLSGGIDSSLIVALMQAQASRPVKTFTVGFENPAFDEAPFAAAVARHLGTDHTELVVTENDARAVIPRLPELYDEPFADSSQIPTHLVCCAARAQVTVALSGDAGDELFGGYNRYFWGPRVWRRLDWMPFGLRRSLGHAIAAVPIPVLDRVGAIACGSVSRPGDKAHRLAARLREVETQDDLYRSLVSEWPGQRLVRGLSVDLGSVLDDPLLPSVLEDDPVGRMMAQDMRSYLPDDILCKVDRAAMGVSLETRVPFLDPEVMSLSARLPPDMRIRDGQGKWALRQILYRHVPRELIERPKTGFGIPVGDWLRGPLRAWAEDLLSQDALARDGLIDPAPVRQAWAEHLSGRRDWTYRLWIVLMFMAWRTAQK
ncbi:asparagine synthase [Rhodomicrobium udaipurense JA643]|uniref:asparagine synthase (glutamine-hydrolyzing) n=1 Tax=Rhodomicrobium udaipurense TaxID=1202716 RepID=A0A8I1GII7_9HYPH|nr:asparagine synthase (glutamine-hydrolyzing) [Rhodomicrobium udaipurense]KAI94080.1 asparagine synthase [Rhodomicrobium udaipurense JA643]MBJ7545136.1 asparagine synthase (glutamine-hydrolyzing) [Rhodomicrobium udaipurense]